MEPRLPETVTRVGSFLARALAGWLLVAGPVWRAWAGAPQGGAASASASELATPRPATGPAAFLRDRPEQTTPIPRARTVEEALAFDPDERKVLGDVADGDGQLDAAALYVLLRRAEMLPPEDRTFEEAEQPNPKSLWTEPGRYRARLVRVTGRPVGQVTDWSDQVKFTPWWGRRPAYVLYLRVPKVAEPILVFLTRKPPDRLPPNLRVAGLFYKLVSLPENRRTGDPAIRHEYPVIVARAVLPAESGGGLPAEFVVFFSVVIVMLVIFLMLRRYLSRHAPRAGRAYRPRRAEQATAPPGEAARDVDEELRRQVEAARGGPGASQGGEHADDADHPG